MSGFHTPMEKECLDLLLRGTQPVVHLPRPQHRTDAASRHLASPIAEGRMLVLSPFGAPHHRATADLAEQRNCFVSTLARTVVIAHAHPGSKIDRLHAGMWLWANRLYTLNLPENAGLMQHGVAGYTVPDLVDCLLGQQVRLNRSTGAHMD